LSALTCTAGMMVVAACVALGWTANTKRGAPEGVVPLLQPAARIDDRPAHQSCFGISDVLRDFSGAPERPAQADRPDHLVHPNHRYDEGLERDPPLGERTPGHLRQPERAPRLRHQAEPTLARQRGSHARVA